MHNRRQQVMNRNGVEGGLATIFCGLANDLPGLQTSATKHQWSEISPMVAPPLYY